MTSTTQSTARTIRTSDLTSAQRKVLVALFGEIPDAKALALVGRKGNAKVQPECECGCGETAQSVFLAGHDASLKSALKAVAGGTEPTCEGGRGSAARALNKAAAAAQLAKRGW